MSVPFMRAPFRSHGEQRLHWKGTNCSQVFAALGQPVNRQLADLARKCKLAPSSRIDNRKNSKLSRSESR